MDLNNFFFAEVLPKAYDTLGTAMLLFASSAAAQMSIANCMNYGPLFLSGVDFSLVRFKKWIQENGQWVQKPDIDPIAAKPIKSSNGIWTDPLQVFYKISTISVWRIDHCQAFITSRQSAITEMPFADIHDVIAKQGLGFDSSYLTPQGIEDAAELYLARRNHFIIKFKDGGVRAVECPSERWRDSVTSFMVNTNLAGMRQESREVVDIEENLKRFDWLKK
jgi:hypothetical protein